MDIEPARRVNRHIVERISVQVRSPVGARATSSSASSGSSRLGVAEDLPQSPPGAPSGDFPSPADPVGLGSGVRGGCQHRRGRAATPLDHHGSRPSRCTRLPNYPGRCEWGSHDPSLASHGNRTRVLFPITPLAPGIGAGLLRDFPAFDVVPILDLVAIEDSLFYAWYHLDPAGVISAASLLLGELAVGSWRKPSLSGAGSPKTTPGSRRRWAY